MPSSRRKLETCQTRQGLAPEMRLDNEAPQPERPVESTAYGKITIELFRQIERDRLAVMDLDPLDESGQLGLQRAGRDPAGPVSAIFQIDRRRQRVGFDGYAGDEIRRLVRARPAEGEEMIGAALDAGVARGEPVRGEAAVPVVAALGRLDVSEADALHRQLAPVDAALVMGDAQSDSV